MSNLIVNNITSYTGTSPLSINDSVAFSGSVTNENQHPNHIPDGINGAFAHGYKVTASAFGAHAEGESTKATGVISHAEGWKSQATATYAHAEGEDTRATAPGAHSEGYETTASHNHAHAEGISTTTGKVGQHVSGKYNRQNANALTVIGNGTGISARRNIAEFYSGNMTLSGSLLIVSGANTIVKVETLPTSDPETAGQLFTTQSAGTGGNLDGTAFRVLCVSQG